MFIPAKVVMLFGHWRTVLLLAAAWALGALCPTDAHAVCHADPVICCDGAYPDYGQGVCSSYSYCQCFPTACACNLCCSYPWACDPCYTSTTPGCANPDDLLAQASSSCDKSITCDAVPAQSCQDNASPAADEPEVAAGDPVSLFSGAETFARTDLRIGNVHGIAVKRRYHSGSGFASRLGYGWGLNYDQRLYTYADGSVVLRKESGWKRRFTLSGSGYLAPVGETGTLAKNADGTFTLTQKSGARENYDTLGRLSSLVDAAGNALVFTYESTTRAAQTGLLPENVGTTPLIVAYDYRIARIEEKNAAGTLTGVYVDFLYDAASGLLTTVTDSTGRSVGYGHDGYGNLTSVAGPLGGATYIYGDSASVHHLVEIDEGAGLFVNQYDSRGRVSLQSHAGGEIAFNYLVAGQKTLVTTTVRDTSGGVLNTRERTVEFDNKGQIVKETDTFGNVNNFSRDGNGRITYQDYRESTPGGLLVLKTASSFTYDTRGNVLTRTDAVGTNLQQTTTYTYHPIFNAVATETVKSVVDPSKNRVTTNSYDDAGNLTSVRVTGMLDPTTSFDYATTLTYDPANGHLRTVDGPRSDVQDVTTFNYDPTIGFLTSIFRPVIGTTTFDNHDSLGNPRTVTDPNGQQTLYTYDAAGRVLTMQEAGITSATQLFYLNDSCTSCGTASDKIDYILRPNGNKIDFGYDENGNLVKITDHAGNSINYSYDSAGNRLKEERRDGLGVQRQALGYVYDELDRIRKVVNPDATFAAFGYDFAGRRIGVTDFKSQTTAYRYDALGRLDLITQPGSVTTTFGYTANGDLASVTDARNNTTTYKIDDLGRVYQTISPDTGTTSYSYDPAGNLIAKTDAMGVTTSYLYDATNRLTKVDFPTDADIVYGYDNNTLCPNSKGRLCSVSDTVGTISYEYSERGTVKKETRTLNGSSLITQYAHDMNNNLAQITYPSGRVVNYSYGNDRVGTVRTTVGGVTSNLASRMSYAPFGPMRSHYYGNGLLGFFQIDTAYRPSAIVLGGNSPLLGPSVLNLTYANDANGNVTAITDNLDATKTKGYGYDSLDRLTDATGPWGSLSWSYDKVGNRLGEGATSYVYPTTSNRLSSDAGTAWVYDNNGNVTAAGTRSYVYDQNQRLVQVADGATSASYAYNGLGQRVKKTVNGVTTLYHYDLDGRLLAELDASGVTQVEYVYLNGQPLAMIRDNNVYYYHNDHLGTPQKMTDSTKAVVWSGEFKPFGQAQSVTGTVTNNLRFPGQYYDAETGLHYNYFRDYNPATGRYVEADPIGLAGGVNLYSYVQNIPTKAVDPLGLWGTLIIYSYSGGDGSLSGHSWIEYDWEDRSRVTYGTYGNHNGAQRVIGLNRDSELNYPFTASMSVAINDEQEEKLIRTIKDNINKGERAWGYLSPCSDFASDVWEYVTGSSISDRNLLGISNPNTLAKSINKLKSKPLGAKTK